MEPITIISILLGIIVGAVVGYFVRKSIAEAKIAGAKNAAEQILEDAKRDADSLKKKLCLRQRMKFTNFVQKPNVRFVNEEMNCKNKKTVYCKEKRIQIEKMNR